MKVDIEVGGWVGREGRGALKTVGRVSWDADLCDADLHKRPGGPRVGRWGGGSWVARKMKFGKGTLLALGKYLAIRVACGRLNFCIFGQLREEKFIECCPVLIR